jgi:hypothetical protein
MKQEINTIINLALDITEQTNYDAFVKYSGHVHWFSIDICEKNDAIFELKYINSVNLTYPNANNTLLHIIEDLNTFLLNNKI